MCGNRSIQKDTGVTALQQKIAGLYEVEKPTAGTYYTIMYIYEDLEGNAEIGDLQNIEMGYR